MDGIMLQQLTKHYYHYTNTSIRPTWVCTYCGQCISCLAVIYCTVNIYITNNIYPKWNVKYDMRLQQIWHPKPEILDPYCLHLPQSLISRIWYFDSDFSRHMTGERNYLKNINPYFNIYVAFGDCVKGRNNLKSAFGLSRPSLS